MNWFDVSKQGLAKLVEGRRKVFILHELISNAWDEKTTMVDVLIEPEENVPKAIIVVTDDSPHGFKNIAHAWTLFADNPKREDAEKRGRFTLGEKLVLALCDEARIKTTTGSVLFDARGRTQTRHRTERGSVFEGLIRLTREEMRQALSDIKLLLPPKNKKTLVNKEEIPYREPSATFEAVLPTVIADAEGYLKPSKRKTLVHVHDVLPGEAAHIFEMGVPVVETGDRYHLDVQQKIPLNADRDNVTPAYLKLLRALVLNSMHEGMSKEDMQETWVTDATTHQSIAPEAVTTMLDARYGEKRAVFDAYDLEANKRFVAAGGTIIHGPTLPSETWKNIRQNSLAQPAGKLTPGRHQTFSPDGDPLKTISPDLWTSGMRKVVDLYRRMAQVLMDRNIDIVIANDLEHKFPASYGDGQLILNKVRLGAKFFEQGINIDVVKLGLHELAHDEIVSGEKGAHDHLSDEYHDGCNLLGARLAFAVAEGRIKLS